MGFLWERQQPDREVQGTSQRSRGFEVDQGKARNRHQLHHHAPWTASRQQGRWGKRACISAVDRGIAHLILSKRLQARTCCSQSTPAHSGACCSSLSMYLPGGFGHRQSCLPCPLLHWYPLLCISLASPQRDVTIARRYRSRGGDNLLLFTALCGAASPR